MTDNVTKMQCLQTDSMRRLVEQANALGIQKEDILKVMYKDATFYLLYYK